MPTWTELIGCADANPGKVERCLSPDDMYELLVDLPHHPNVLRVREVLVTLDSGDCIELSLKGGRMSSGASGPILPNAADGRDFVQPWRVTPVLGNAGAPSEPVIARSRPVEDVHGSSMPVGAGWFEGLRPWPEVTTAANPTKPDAMDRLIILPGDA